VQYSTLRKSAGTASVILQTKVRPEADREEQDELKSGTDSLPPAMRSEPDRLTSTHQRWARKRQQKTAAKTRRARGFASMVVVISSATAASVNQLDACHGGVGVGTSSVSASVGDGIE